MKSSPASDKPRHSLQAAPRPLHPLLRAVAMVLVFALTLTGPVPQVAVAVVAPDGTGLISITGDDASFSLPAGVFSGTVTVSPSVTIGDSGPEYASQLSGNLSFGLSLVGGGTVKGLVFSQDRTLPFSPDIISLKPFDTLAVAGDGVSTLKLGSGGLIVPDGIQLFSQVYSQPGVGKLVLTADQVWQVGALESYVSYVGADPLSILGSSVGTGIAPVRVESDSGTTAMTLTLQLDKAADPTQEFSLPSAAYLNAGSLVNLVKKGAGYLQLALSADLYAPEAETRPSFSGTLTIHEGSAEITEGFMAASVDSLKGPSIKFATSGSTFGNLIVSGSNVVTGIDGGYGVIRSNGKDLGILTVAVAGGGYSKSGAVFQDSDGLPISLVKTGSGYFGVSDPAVGFPSLAGGSSSFTGGFTLVAGTLGVGYSSSISEGGDLFGPLGGGVMNFVGGTLRIEAATSAGLVLSNQIYFGDSFGVYGNDAPVNATVEGGTLTLDNSFGKSMDLTFAPSLNLTLNSPLVLKTGIDYGTVLDKRGPSALVIAEELLPTGTYFDPGLLILSGGTLSFNRALTGTDSANGASLSISADLPGNVRTLSAGKDIAISVFNGIRASADFRYEGGMTPELSWVSKPFQLDLSLGPDGTNLSTLTLEAGSYGIASAGSVGINVVSGILTFGNIVSTGSAGLSVLGAGTLQVAGSFNPYSLDLAGGILRLMNSNGINYGGTVSVSSGPSTLFVEPSVILTLNGPVLGTAGLVKAGSGKLIFAGQNSLTGTLTLSGGVTSAGTASAFGVSPKISFTPNTGSVLQINGFSTRAAVYFSPSETDPSAKRIENGSSAPATMTFDQPGTFSNSPVGYYKDSYFYGALTDGGAGVLSVAKAGSGYLTLLGGTSNTFTGSTSVTDGTLQAGALSLSRTSSISVTGGSFAAVNYNASAPLTIGTNGRATITGTNQTISGSILNNGISATSLNFSGTLGTISLTGGLSGSGNSRFASNANISGGSISGGSVTVTGTLLADISAGTVSAGSLSSNAISGGNVTVSNSASVASLLGGVLSVSGTAGLTSVSGGNVNAGSLNAGGISGGLLSVTTWGNVTTLSGGSLTIGGVATLGAVSGGTLNLNGASSTITSLTGGSVKLGNSGVLNVQAGSSSGVISGVGSLVKTTTDLLSLGASNTFTGSTTVSAGTLAFFNTGSVAGSLGVSSGAKLVFGNNSNTTYAGSLTGSGALEKTGASTLLLTNGSAFTGVATISGGTLAVTSLLGGNLGSVVLNQGTLNLISLSGVSAPTGSVTGTGTTWLTGTLSQPLSLTLGAGTSLGGTVKIGQYATLTLASGFSGTVDLEVAGGNLNFGGSKVLSTTSKLTLSSGTINLGGYLQEISTLTLVGGSLKSVNGSNVAVAGTITYDALPSGLGTVTQGSLVSIQQNTQVEIVGSSTLRLTSGVLKDLGTGTLASAVTTGGTTVSTGIYPTVEARYSRTGGGSLTFNQPVVASGSVIASVGAGTYFLSVQAPVNAPMMDIQNGVTAVIGAGGSYTTLGTLQVGGVVLIAGGIDKAFGTVSLQGGTLASVSGERVSFTGVNATSGALLSSLASTAGDITMSGPGILTVANSTTSNSSYTGALHIAGGTVVLGNYSALGAAGTVVFDNPSAGVLRLNGFSTTLASVTGSGTIENASGSSATLKLEPTSNSTLNAVVQDGSGTRLNFEKSGARTLTIGTNQLYQGTTTVSGGSLVLASGVSLASGGASALQVNGGVFDLGGNTQQFNSVDLTLGTVRGGTLSVSSSNGFTVSEGIVDAVFTGAGGLTKFGNGIVTFNTVSSYVGATTINGGTLALGANGLLGGGSITISGGLFNLGASTQSLANVILSGGAISGGSLASNTTFDFQSGTAGSVLNGSAKLTKTGSGSVTLSQVNAFTGGVSLNQGSLIAAVDGAIPAGGSLAITGGTLSLGNTTQTTGSVTFTDGLLSGGTLRATDYTLTGGTILTVLGGTSASTSVTVSSGTVRLNTASTYAGGTNINSGRLVLGTLNALNASGAVTLGGGELSLGTTSQTVGTVTLNSGSITGGSLTSNSAFNLNSGAVSSTLNGSAALTKGGSGVLNLNTANSYTGSTILSAGTLNAVAGALGGSGVLTVNGGSLNAVDFKNAATLDVNSGAASFSVSGGSLGAVSNASQLQFTASSGTIVLGALSGVGATSFGSNAYIFGGISAGSVTVGGLLTSDISGGVVTASSLVSSSGVSGGNTTVSGAATVGSFSNGILTIGGGAALTTVSGGTLNLNGNTASITTLNGGSVVLSSNDVLTVNNGNSSGVISGGGALVKASSGVLALGGVNTYTGYTNVTAGTITASAGALSGSGSLNVNGGALDAVDFKNLATLNVNSGSASFSTNGGTFGAVTNAALLRLAGLTGTITMSGLSGNGTTSFASDARITGGSITAGAVGVAGLLSANIAGGSVSTGALSAGVVSGGITSVTNAGSVATVSGGTLSVNGVATLGTVSNGSLNLNGATSSIDTLNGGALNLGGSNLLSVSAGSTSGAIKGTGSLSKVGSGNLTLSGANTFTGETNVNGGTLTTQSGALSSTGSIGVSSGSLSAVNYNAAATLNVASGAAARISGAGLNLGGGVKNNSALGVNFSDATGTITLGSLSGSGATSFAGGASITGGISAGSVTVGSLLISDISGGVVTASSLVSSSGVSGGNTTVSGAATVGSFSNGVLTIGGGAALTTVSGGTLNLNGNTASITTLNGGSVVLASNDVLTVSNGNSSGVISGGGALVKASSGVLALGGVNTFTGYTNVTAGTITASAGALSGSGSLNVNGGALDAVDFKNLATLNVNSGSASFSTNGGTFGAVTNAALLRLAGLTGTITMSGLSGNGTTSFASDARITGGSITAGAVGVAGLLSANIAGGSVSTGALSAGVVSGGITSVTNAGSAATVSGGTMSVNGVATLGTVSNGSLYLNGATSSIDTLNGGALNLGGSNVLSVSAGSTSGAIKGTGSLTKVGSGNLTLSGANTFTGETNVNGGTLTTQSGALASTGSIGVSSGSLSAVNYNTAATLNVASGAFARISGAGLNLGGGVKNNSALGVNFSDATGTITLGSLTGAGATSFAGGASIAGGISDGIVTVGSLLTSDISGGVVTASSLLSSSGVSGGNTTVSGAATVGSLSNGILTIGGGAALTTVSGGTLNLNGTTASSISSLTGGSVALGVNQKLSVSTGNSNGVISGAGSLIKVGAGALTLSGANTLTGSTTIREGILQMRGVVGGSFILGDSLSSATSAPVLSFGANSDKAISSGTGSAGYTATLLASNASGTTTLSGPISLVTGAGSFALQSATGGMLDIQGAWTSTGKNVTIGSAVNAGTVKLSSQLATSGSVNVAYGSVVAGVANVFLGTTTVNLAGSTILDLGAYSTSASKVSIAGGSLLGTGAITASSYSVESGYVGALLGGAGALTKTGAGLATIAGANSGYNGLMTVSAGTLAFAGAGTTGGSLNNNAAVVFNNTSDVSLSRPVYGSGSLTKNGSSALNLNGGATYTGATNINAGSLIVAGILGSSSVLNQGTLQLLLSAGSSDFSPTISGNGALLLNTAGASSTLNTSGSWTFSSLSVGNAVTLNMYSSARAAGLISVLDGGILIANGATIDPAFVTISNSGRVRLTIDSIITPSANPYDIGSNYVATFTSAGGLASGTLQIEGTVDLGGNTKAFSAVSLRGGTLTNGTLSSGALYATAGAVSAGFASGFGDVIKAGSGALALSGSSPSYAGTAHLVEGTLRLGGASALGTGSASVAFESTGGASVLQLNGNSLTLAALSNSGEAILENGGAQAATLTLNNSGVVTYSGTLRNGAAGVLAFVKDGAGTARLSGNLAYTGGTTVRNGSLMLGSALAGGPLAVSGGTLDLGAYQSSVDAVSFSGGLVQNGSLTGAAYSLEAGIVSAVLLGSADVVKSGAGSATLSGANILTGAVDVRAGSLFVTGSGLLSSGSLKASGADTVLDLGATSQSVGVVSLSNGAAIRNGVLTGSSYAFESGSVTAALSGVGVLTKTTLGTITLGGANTLTGTMDIKGGQVVLLSTGSLSSGSLMLGNGSRLDLGLTAQTVGQVTLASGTISNGNLSSTVGFELVSGSVGAVLGGNVALNKTGTSVVTLASSNSYSGGTNVSAGTLVLAANDALGSGNVSVSGVVSLGSTSQNLSSGSLNLTSGSVSGSGALTAAAYNLSSGQVSAVLNGAGIVTKKDTGTVILSGANTLSGSMDLQSGTLALSESGALSSGSLIVSGAYLDLGGKSQNVGAVTLNSGSISNGSLTGSSYDLSSGYISAVLRGSATLTQSTGVTTLLGLNTLTGPVNINSGTLILANGLALSNASGVTIAAPAALKFASGVTTASLKSLTGDLSLTNQAGQGVALTLDTASDATYADVLTGTGSLIKDGAGNLTLVQTPVATVGVGVLNGSLTAGNLLSGARTITTARTGTLNVALDSSSTVYSGNLSGAGSVFISAGTLGSGSLVATSSTKLDGALTLGTGLTLDLLNSAAGIFGGNSTLTLDGSNLVFGSQELELLTINLSGAFSVTGSQGKILYDVKPSFLDDNNNIISGSQQITGVTFDVLTKGGALAGGDYRFIAGRVRDKAVTGMLTGGTLYLDPQNASTVIRLKDITAFNNGIIAGGSLNQGGISIEALTYTSSLTIGSGIHAVLAESGTLLSAMGTLAATPIANSGALEVSVLSGERTVSNRISGTGSLSKTGDGVAVFTANNSYTGATTLERGVFVLGSATALGGTSGAIIFRGGSLRYGAGQNLDLSARIAPIGSGTVATIDTASNTVTFASALSGAGALNKSGLGSLVLTGDNSALTGSVNVKAGTLQIGAFGALGSVASDVNIETGATLRLARTNGLTLSQSITGDGGVEQAGSGTTTLAGNNSFSGGLVLSAGTLLVNADNALGTAGSIYFKGGVLQYGISPTQDYSSRFSKVSGESIKVDTNGRDVAFASALEGNGSTLWKGGAGRLTLTDSLYTGDTTVAAGTLELLGTQSGFSRVNVTAGRVLYTLGDTQVAAGSVAAGSGAAAVFAVASGSATFSGAVTGSGVFQKQGAGSLLVLNSQTNSGGVFLQEGTLTLGSGFIAAAALSTSAGTTLKLGDGSLEVGTLTLNAASTIQLVDSGNPDDAATIFARSVQGSPILSGNVSILTQGGSGGSSSTALSGALKGTIRSLPSYVTDLTVEANGGAKVKFQFSDSALSFQSLTLQPGVNAELASSFSLTQSLTVNAATLAITAGTLNAPGAVLSLNSHSTATVSGASTSLVAQSLSLNDGSTLSLSADALNALSGVSTLTVGGTNSSGVATGGSLTLAAGTGTLVVASGQMLKGSGTINGNIALNNAEAVFSPGNSPGTIYIAGSLNLSNGVIVIEKSAGAQDQIATSGLVSIGSSASLVLVDYDHTFAAGGTFSSIFSGTGSVTGNFGNIVFARRNSLGNNVASVLYTTTMLSNGTVTISRTPLASLPVRGNILSFAKAADARVQTPAGSQSDALMEIGQGVASIAGVPAQLAAANPAVYAELAGLSAQRTLMLNQSVLDHFSSLRAGLMEASEGEFQLWTSGYGSWHKQNGDASMGEAGFSGSTWGEAFGVERRLGNLTLGLMGASGHTGANFTALPGSVSTDAWHGGAYASAKVSGFVLESAAMYGSADSVVKRSISAQGLTQQEARTEMNSHEWLVNVGVAKPLNAGSLVFTPSLRLIAQGQTLDAAREGNLSGLDVAIAKQQSTNLLHQTGIEARRNFKMASLPSAASLQVDWIHNYHRKGHSIDMALAGDTNTSAGYKGADSGSDAFRVGAAFETAITRRVNVRITLDYQAQSKANTTRGALSVGYSF